MFGISPLEREADKPRGYAITGNVLEIPALLRNNMANMTILLDIDTNNPHEGIKLVGEDFTICIKLWPDFGGCNLYIAPNKEMTEEEFEDTLLDLLA
jgi:hypothetical protein